MASTKMTWARTVRTSKAPTVKAAKPRATAADKGAARLKAVARQAADAAASMTNLASEATHHTLAFNPLIGLQGCGVHKAVKSLLKAVAGAPRKTGSRYASYLKKLGSRKYKPLGAAPGTHVMEC